MPRGRSALSGALLALAVAAPLHAQTPPGTPVKAVDFVGNRTFDDATLATAIATNSGQCKVLALMCAIGVGKEPYYFDQPTLQADVVRLRIFYYEHGFREATVSADTAATRSRSTSTRAGRCSSLRSPSTG
jgi:outer membrane protein assembly factor BamA